MLCCFCFSHRNFGCFDLVCLIVSSTCVIFPIGITVICNIICSWMGHIYAATPGQNPGVARIYIYNTCIYIYVFSYCDILCIYRAHMFTLSIHITYTWLVHVEMHISVQSSESGLNLPMFWIFLGWVERGNFNYRKGGKSNIAGWKIPEPKGGFNGKITINGLLWAGALTSDILCYV